MNSRLAALFVGTTLAASSLGHSQVPFTSTRNDPQGHLTLLANKPPVFLQSTTAPQRTPLTYSTDANGAPVVRWKFTPSSTRVVRGPAGEIPPPREARRDFTAPLLDSLKTDRDAVLTRKRELERQIQLIDSELLRLESAIQTATSGSAEPK